ncbi:tetratricopeptide repeat protein [Serinicoccus sp. CNJ-927]|uniref:tetratricopeptide repeat protein n=1 Tax=Serinicoccus sp. CNJ-927 TaxID=1904970 RepID=UPI0016510697|nr:hypothetical protein [Serinicoccus sp. CNJ-927]
MNDDRRRAGRGGSERDRGWGAPVRGRGGSRDDVGRDERDNRRPPRVPEPPLPEDADAGGLDRSLLSELRTLSKENAEGVGGHLVMVGRMLDAEDLDRALAHAEAAARRAGRIAGVREALGVVHYRRGEWSKALAELRTARRLSGSQHLLPLLADVERGLGRPERALELAASPEAAQLGPAEQVELVIVVAGARADLGQHAAAVLLLEEPAKRSTPKQPWAARLRYAYAAALEADGREEQALEWYARAAEVDALGETDAAELLGRGEESWVVDLGDDEVDDGGEEAVDAAGRRDGGESADAARAGGSAPAAAEPGASEQAADDRPTTTRGTTGS